MIYAPIIIPTLNRFESFKGCIESLKKNKWSRFTDVIVAVDYPKNNTHVYGYNKILSYLNGTFNEFNSFKVIKRKKNYGAIDNFEKLVEECLRKYDRCICTFDDLEHSPNFIEYMDKCLNIYETDQNTMAVLGYSYPVQWSVKNSCNIIKENFVGSIWGVGFWRDKYNEMKHYIHSGQLIKSFDREYDKQFDQMTDWAIKDYVNSICYGFSKKSFLTKVTDISMRIYLAAENKRFIMPIISKVRNHGFDGSGTFCERIDSKGEKYISSNYSFHLQQIDEAECFVPIEDKDVDIECNRRLLNQFDYVDPEITQKCKDAARKYRATGKTGRLIINIRHFVYRTVRFLKRVKKKHDT